MAGGLARLKRRADFLRVAGTRIRAVAPGLILQAAPPSAAGGEADAAIRVGFTATRKIGNAVVRNRAKRRLRAVAATVLPRQGRGGTDYVLIARAATGARDYPALVADLEGALRRLGRDRGRAAATGGVPLRRAAEGMK
jgi:ribonuclease P protein component